MNTKRVKTYRLIIKGKVQDVGFRYWVRNLALSFKLNGYVMNRKKNNEVEIIVQGNIVDILSIMEKSKIGPELAMVEEVISKQIFNNIQYKEFKVKYQN